MLTQPQKLKMMKNQIIEEFKDGKSIRQLEKEYCINGDYISKLLKDENIKVISHINKNNHLREVQFTDEQKQLALGTFLGDAYTKNIGKTTFMSINHCIAQKEWALKKAEFLSPFVVGIKESLNIKYPVINIRTCCHQDLNFLNDMYIDHPNPTKMCKRLKIVPEGLDKYFTPLTLAAWYLDDGCIKKNNIMFFATEGFNLESNLNLIKYMKNCFDVNVDLKMGKGQYYLRVERIESIKIYYLIKDLSIIPDCMRYKLDIKNFGPKQVQIDPNNFTDQDLINYYNDGLKICNIASKTKISSEEVERRISGKVKWRSEIFIKEQHCRQRIKIKEYSEKEIIEMYQNGKWPSKISAKTKLPIAKIIDILNRGGIAMKTTINRNLEILSHLNSEQKEKILKIFDNKEMSLGSICKKFNINDQYKLIIFLKLNDRYK